MSALDRTLEVPTWFAGGLLVLTVLVWAALVWWHGEVAGEQRAEADSLADRSKLLRGRSGRLDAREEALAARERQADRRSRELWAWEWAANEESFNRRKEQIPFIGAERRIRMLPLPGAHLSLVDTGPARNVHIVDHCTPTGIVRVPVDPGQVLDAAAPSALPRSESPTDPLHHEASTPSPAFVVADPVDLDAVLAEPGRVFVGDTANPPSGWSLHSPLCDSAWIVDGIRGRCTCWRDIAVANGHPSVFNDTVHIDEEHHHD